MGKKFFFLGVEPLEHGEPTLVVYYEEEIINEDGRPIRTRKSKKISLSPFSPASDVATVAEQVVDKCRQIPPSRVSSVEAALVDLQRRLLRERTSDGYDQAAALPEANMNQLDDYMEMMYDTDEDYSNKNRGTGLVVKLCQHVGNLELLIQNHSLMALLSRLLDTEHKKSLEMVYNIIRVFLSFSTFEVMHDLLAQYKVGSLTLKVLTYETDRAEQRLKDEAALEAEERRLEVEARMGGGEGLDSFKKKKKKQLRKAGMLKRLSEKVLHVGYYLLLNLAEDQGTERKMLKRQLLEGLMKHLDHASSSQLLLLITAFIKKLSVFEDNKNKLKSLQVVRKLARLLPCKKANGEVFEPLLWMVLRLLFNLSFDAQLREQMVQESLIPRLVDLLVPASPRARTVILKLLYHLSTEDKVKGMFTYTEAIPIVMQMLLNFPKPHIGPELAALAVNLSWHPRNAEAMAHYPSKGRGVYELVGRAEKTLDPLLMKVIRNLSSWTLNQQLDLPTPEKDYTLRGMWGRFIDQLMDMLHNREASQDLVVEVLGTMSNLTVLDMPRAAGWAKIIKNHDLLSYVSRLLVPGMAQHDVVLEVVLLVGQFLTDSKTGPLIASSGVVSGLHELWKDRHDDAEIQLQLLDVFYRLLHFEETREEVLYSTRAVMDMLGCVDHRHPTVRALALDCLEIVLEVNRGIDGSPGELGQQILKRRFQAHNQEWLEAMEREDGLRGGAHSSLEGGESRMAHNLSGWGGGGPGGYDEFGGEGDGKFADEEEDYAYFTRHGSTERLAMDMDAISPSDEKYKPGGGGGAGYDYGEYSPRWSSTGYGK